MKYLHYFFTWIMTLNLLLLIFIFSFEVAIYGDSQYTFFKYEYKKNQINDKLNLKMNTIMDITEDILNYIRGKNDNLKYTLVVDNQEINFFNEQDILHLKDVREIFVFVFKLKYILLILIVICAIILIKLKGDWINLIPNFYFINLTLFLLLLFLFFGITFLNFKEVFYFCHSIIFNNNLWLFQPQTDLMIQLFPLSFFKDFIIYFLLILIIFVILFSCFFYKWKKILK